MDEWWRGFFDADYVRLWAQGDSQAAIAAQVDGLWAVLGLREGSRVLDAPCGYGRISRPLAERGAVVLGVDRRRRSSTKPSAGAAASRPRASGT